jgi:hypothetical protein
VRAAERWLAALGARRLGRVALDGGLPERGRLASAFWLDGQRPVWMRTATAPDAERLAAEAALQRDLALPGIAAVVEHGVASGIPYVAVSAAGRLLPPDVSQLDAGTAFALAAAAGRVLHALALGGAVLPDAEPERFVTVAPATLTLADLDGVQRADREAALAAHTVLAAGLAARLLHAGVRARLAPDVGEALDRALRTPRDLRDLSAVLDRAALNARRD